MSILGNLHSRWRVFWDGPCWQLFDEDRKWAKVKDWPAEGPTQMPDPHILLTLEGRKKFLAGINDGTYGHGGSEGAEVNAGE